MIHFPSNHPIQQNATHDIHDSSKIKCFMDCPRQYLWRYGLGWTGQYTSEHLVHGEGMHRVLASLLEYKYKHGSYPLLYTKEGEETDERRTLMDEYITYYRDHFGFEQDEENDPKNPAGASVLLDAYVDRYREEDKRYKVVETSIEVDGSKLPAIEVSGRTFLSFSEQRKLHYRIDAVVEDSKGLWVMDHKTATNFNRQWQQQWALSFQMFLYSHACLGIFGHEKFCGFIVNGLSVKRL